ncbi:MAG TPA: sugar ABC transporter permease [Geminicoccaceae bacterium]|nr:sugar ABC transporter permease [Geminicoccus sp.]HMU49197.1 sugar ABC transporter permease [Geminicoccaceae bacterium]
MSTAALSTASRHDGGGFSAVVDRLSGYVLTAPVLAVLVLLMAYPLGYAVWLGFVQWKPGASVWIGVDNYVRLFTDPLFWNALRNTVFYTFWNVTLGTALSLALALLMNRPGIAARLLRLSVFMPVIVSTPVAALAWLWLFDVDYGLINRTLIDLGIVARPVPWLNSPFYSRWSMVIVNVWLGTGLSAMLFLAALQGVPKELYEAATLDGANPWHSFRAVTLPHIRPTLVVVMIIKLIGSFKTFDQIFIMTGGGPLYRSETILIYLYRQGFEYFDFGFAAAVGIVFLVIVAALSLGQAHVLKDRRR